MRRPRRDRGFTLLEVMVALAVLAASLMAVADLSGNALRNYVYARDLSVATLLARGKMAELEEKYEDSGFTDFDQTEDGNFADQGQPGMTWRLELRKPTSELTAEKILDGFLGGGTGEGEAQDLVGKLLGSSAAAGAGGAKGGPSSGVPGGILGGVLQGQIKAFTEELKRGVRQVTLRVAWKDGKVQSGFDVSTYWVVLNPKAPGGARGQNPDIPPNLAPPSSQLTRQPGVPALPGSRQPGIRTPRGGTGGGTQ